METTNISAMDVMALRQRTGLGMMDCKKALVEASGDMDAAEASLKEKLKGTIEEFAREALRTIGLVYRDISEGMGGPMNDEKSETNPHLFEIEEVKGGKGIGYICNRRI